MRGIDINSFRDVIIEVIEKWLKVSYKLKVIIRISESF